MVNYFELEPAEQRQFALAKFFNYLRRYVGPYHPYLRCRYAEAKVDLARLRTADDLRRLPIVDKTPLRENPQAFILRPHLENVPALEGYPTERLSRSLLLKYVAQAILNRPKDYTRLLRNPSFRERVRRRGLLEWLPVHFHASTGSTGKPTPAAYTHYDLTRVLPELAAALVIPKRPDPNEVYFDFADRGMNIFPGAPHLAFFIPVLAKTAIGTSTFDTFGGTVIPTDRQITIFAEGGFSSLTAVPSYLVYWFRRAKELQAEGQIGPLTALKRVLVGAEPLSDTMRECIRALALELGAHPRFRIYQTLGMTEMKWGFAECTEGSGLHLNPRFFYWELLHPDTREPVAEREPGVLVFSHIDWRGTVLVRYWTGDLVKGGMTWERCQQCGYTFPKIYAPICRAEKDFTKIKGTRVDLSNLVESVRGTPGVRNFQVLLESEDQHQEFSRDLVTIQVAVEPGYVADDVGERIRSRVKLSTEVSPDRIVFEPDERQIERRLFERTGIKAEYVVERRKLHI